MWGRLLVDKYDELNTAQLINAYVQRFSANVPRFKASDELIRNALREGKPIESANGTDEIE